MIGKCIQCNRKKSMIVRDNTRTAKNLGNFFKKLGGISAKVGRKIGQIVLKKPAKIIGDWSKIW